MTPDEEFDRIHRDLGFRRLSRTWAKLEILLGLAAASTGLLCGVSAVVRSETIEWPLAVAGVILQVLGSYLAMAGHRSHAYQSQTRLAAYLLSRFAVTDEPRNDRRSSSVTRDSAPSDTAHRDAQ